jgi:sensor histidine kinase YesM
VATEVAGECRRVLVPTLLLQPLVENAIRHGRAEVAGSGRVSLAACRRGDRLELVVENDLPSPAEELLKNRRENHRREDGGGVGLASVSERLRLLHGENQSFAAGRHGEVFRVEIRLPWREAGA